MKKIKTSISITEAHLDLLIKISYMSKKWKGKASRGLEMVLVWVELIESISKRCEDCRAVVLMDQLASIATPGTNPKDIRSDLVKILKEWRSLGKDRSVEAIGSKK